MENSSAEQTRLMNDASDRNQDGQESCFIQHSQTLQDYKNKITTMCFGEQNTSGREGKKWKISLEVLQSEKSGQKRDYLLLKLGDFYTDPDFPMKRNLEIIINYSFVRSTTDLSAILLAINAQEKSVKDFFGDVQEDNFAQQKAERLVDIISQQNLSQGVLIVGNKRMHLRLHESILHSISEVTQIGESQSFFVPDKISGTSQQIQEISDILEKKLVKLVPVDLNRFEIKHKISAPKPSMSSFISRLSIRKRANQESQLINDSTLHDPIIEIIKKPTLGAGLTQQLIQDAKYHYYEPKRVTSQYAESKSKREQVESEIDYVVFDDQDSAYMRQIKRLLIHDCQSDKVGGKLVAIQSLQDAEEIVNSMLSVFYQKKSSDDISGIKPPKLVFIASQNQRLQQIQDTIEQQFIKEVIEPPFKLKKTIFSKAQKQKITKKDHDQHETFRTIFNDNQVFILLDKKFFNRLMHGELDISKVDYLIFDEIHSINPESTYVDIMNKFIFNHELMQSPIGQLEENKRLPKVLAFFSLDSVLQAAQNNDQQIMKKFYFMANTFNASLLCLQKQDLVKLERDIVLEFSQSRVRKIQDIIHLGHQVQYSREFLKKARKYLTFSRGGKNRVVCLPQSIIEKKKLQPYLQLDTRFAKITLDEAIYVLNEFGAQLLQNLENHQTYNQKILYKPILESAQWVFLKVRYFSSRIQFDETLCQILGKDNINLFATKLAIASQQNQYEKQSSWLYSPRIYLKKTQSESQAALEMCKILSSLGFLDKYLKPNLVRPSQSLQLDAPSTNQSEQKSSIFSSSEQPEQDQIHNIQQMLPRIYTNQSQEEKAKEFFSGKYQKNKKKNLDEWQKKVMYFEQIMKFNSKQLKLFIKTFLNPILKSINEYNDLCNTQSNQDLIRFNDFNVNMISESSIKELLFQEFSDKKQETKKANETFIQFMNYQQRMFNIYDKNKEPINVQEYPSLVNMIDQSLEKYQFPHYMTQHVPNYYSHNRGKPSQSTLEVKEQFNRKAFLTMLMIALSDKEPSTMEFEKVKEEMGRLALVGNEIIKLCQVITMIFSGKKSFCEKDLDAEKNNIIKSENLKMRVQEVGLDNLKINGSFYQKTEPNPKIELQQNLRNHGDVIKSLAGLFSIYLGFGPTYLLLSDFGVIEPPTSYKMIEIGQNSVEQKVEILKTISLNRKDLLDDQRKKKTQLFNILCNQKFPDLIKEPLTGTEILQVWSKLVKSRGLFMKRNLKNIFKEQETYESDEEDSNSHNTTRQQMGPSYKASQIKRDKYKAKYIEEEKCLLDSDSICISQQKLQVSSDSSSRREKSSKNTDDHTTEEDYEQSKPNQMQVDSFEREYKEKMQEGYEFKNLEILFQSIVHKSYSQNFKTSGGTFKDDSPIKKDIIMEHNYEILEYLGDSILNFTISKLFYCETVENQKQWHGEYFVSKKLSYLIKSFGSNIWLAFALFENFYSTITEEILEDEDFQGSKYAEKAQETICILKNKKITEEDAKKLATRVPLICNTNDSQYRGQINEFNGACFKKCLAADKNQAAKISINQREQLKVTSKSLSLKLFKNNNVNQEEDDEDEVDSSLVDEKFVKFFADVMESLIGGIFMDSGDFDKTQMILLKLINCASVSSIPKEHERTVVLSVFNSKPYCKNIKLSHTSEEKDGSIYIMGWMGQLQFKRTKYLKDRKKKVLFFYYEMRLYLEDAYKEFEMNFVQNRNQDDNRQPTNEEWLQFNQDYRKIWKFKAHSADQKRYFAIKEGAKKLYKFASSPDQNFNTRDNNNIPVMRDEIIKYLNEGLNQIAQNQKCPLLVLEQERVKSSGIRDLLDSSGIKFIDGLSKGMNNVDDFLNKMKDWQITIFYDHLIQYSKTILDRIASSSQ